MATVTQHAIAAVLASAKVHCAGLDCLVFDWIKGTPFMAAVAEWLRRALAAGAPPITLARIHIYGIRVLLGDHWL